MEDRNSKQNLVNISYLHYIIIKVLPLSSKTHPRAQDYIHTTGISGCFVEDWLPAFYPAEHTQ